MKLYVLAHCIVDFMNEMTSYQCDCSNCDSAVVAAQVLNDRLFSNLVFRV